MKDLPKVEARAGYELATLRKKGDESNNEPPRPDRDSALGLQV